MVVSVKCPECGKLHPAPETVLRKAVRCESCGAKFVASEAKAKTFKLVCPNCHRAHPAPETVLGKTVRCEDCQYTFAARVPAAETGVGAAEAHNRGMPSAQAGSHAAGKAATSAAQQASREMPVPPPLPPSPPPAVQAVLDRYRQPRRGGFSTIRWWLGESIRAAARRLRGAKLRWEIGNLEKAYNQQLVQLAQLALQHQPPDVDLRSETSQLTTIQQQLDQKQATAAALKATAGAKAALAEVKRELAELQGRQEATLRQIGDKVEAIRAPIPGADGCYYAVDQIRAALQAKRGELEALGQTQAARVAGLATIVRPLAVLAGVLVMAVALVAGYRLVAGLLAGGVPAYIPSDATLIEYADLTELEGTEELSELAKAFASGTRPLGIEASEVRDFTLVRWQGRNSAVVFRTLYEVALEDMSPGPVSDNDVKRYRGCSYVPIRSSRSSAYPEGYAGRLRSKLYCFARSEESLKTILACYDRGERPQLDEDMELALKSVWREPCYFAGNLEEPDPRWLQALPWEEVLERSVDESHLRTVGAAMAPAAEEVAVGTCLVFSRNRYAERTEEDFQDAVEEIESEIDRAPRSQRSALETLAEVFQRTSIRQRGSAVLLSVTIDREEMEELKSL